MKWEDLYHFRFSKGLDTNEQKLKAVETIGEGLDILQHRQKLVKLADQSENGWRTVTEYETRSLADDSEDEKRIY
jgi:hypothetical protein